MKKAGSRETKLWYMNRADARCLGESDIPIPDSTSATIRVTPFRPYTGKMHSNPWHYPTALRPKSSRMMPSSCRYKKMLGS